MSGLAQLDEWQKQMHLRLIRELRHELLLDGDHYANRLCVALLDGHGENDYIFEAIARFQEYWRTRGVTIEGTSEQRRKRFVEELTHALVHCAWSATNIAGFKVAFKKAMP